MSKIINERGCLEAMEEWAERNMISVTSGVIFILFFQVSIFVLL